VDITVACHMTGTWLVILLLLLLLMTMMAMIIVYFPQYFYCRPRRSVSICLAAIQGSVCFTRWTNGMQKMRATFRNASVEKNVTELFIKELLWWNTHAAMYLVNETVGRKTCKPLTSPCMRRWLHYCKVAMAVRHEQSWRSHSSFVTSSSSYNIMSR
jgi:hypothetical protein